MTPNHKKLLRVYREENLRVRRRDGRKRALGTRAPMVLPDGPNQRWSLDFVSDTLKCSRRFRILCVVGDYTRECLALVADTSLSGVRVARELTRLIELRGKPHTVVSDNGTELTSSAILRWSQEQRVYHGGMEQLFFGIEMLEQRSDINIRRLGQRAWTNLSRYLAAAIWTMLMKLLAS